MTDQDNDAGIGEPLADDQECRIITTGIGL